MERYCSTGQSPQWALAPTEEEKEEEKDKEEEKEDSGMKPMTGSCEHRDAITFSIIFTKFLD
jgi:hypothetical protein